MQWYHVFMVAAFMAAIFISWHNPRARFWSLVLTASYAICETYLFMPKPTSIDIPWDGSLFVGPWGPQSLFNATIDALICVLVLIKAREKWEAGVFFITLIAGSLGILQATNIMLGTSIALPSRVYGLILDVLSCIAISLIITRLLLERVNVDSRFRSGLLGGLADRLMGSIRPVCLGVRRVLQAPWEPSKRWKA